MDLKDLVQAGAKVARNGLSHARNSKAIAGLNQQAQQIMNNAKLSAGRYGQKVKSGLHDVNVGLNLKNYEFQPAMQLVGGGGYGGRFARVGNEPLFSFSSGGGDREILI